MSRKDENYDELHRLDVPRGRLASTTASRSRREQIRPIPVTDYQGVLRQIERRHRREELRKEIIAEARQSKARHKKQFKCFLFLFIVGVVVVVLAVTAAHAPVELLEVPKLLRNFMGM